MTSILDRYAQGAAERLGGRTVCSLTVSDRGTARQVASNDARAAACDRVETHAGAGPCIVAMDELHSVLVEDIGTDTAWPTWRRAALDSGFRSFAAFPAYVDDDVTVAANVYAEDSVTWTVGELVALDRYVQELAGALRTPAVG